MLTYEVTSLYIGQHNADRPTLVVIKFHTPSHSVHDTFRLFKDLLLHEVLIATYVNECDANKLNLESFTILYIEQNASSHKHIRILFVADTL